MAERHPAHPMVVIDDVVYCRFCEHPRDTHSKCVTSYGDGTPTTVYRCNYVDCSCSASWAPRRDGIPETQETQ